MYVSIIKEFHSLLLKVYELQVIKCNFVLSKFYRVCVQVLRGEQKYSGGLP